MERENLRGWAKPLPKWVLKAALVIAFIPYSIYRGLADTAKELPEVWEEIGQLDE